MNDVPLLAENGLAPLYDTVVVVDAGTGTRLERLVSIAGDVRGGGQVPDGRPGRPANSGSRSPTW